MTRSVIITGGTGGLGAAVTKAMLAAGWHAVVPWVAQRELERLPADPRLQPIEADLFAAESVTACVTAADQPGRPLKAIVNLVGGFASGGRLHETSIDEFEDQLRLNLRAGVLMAQTAIPRLMANGGGAFVCVSSQATRKPFSGAAGYLTAKTAVLGLAGALHAEYAKDGVRVNTILPDVIDTPANRAARPNADFSGWTSPEAIAATLVFLCGDDSAAIRGAQLTV
jgi:NAD(P)-dependent dehydrogenase (short-subunit alcohol dehydrogenase family)